MRFISQLGVDAPITSSADTHKKQQEYLVALAELGETAYGKEWKSFIRNQENQLSKVHLETAEFSTSSESVKNEDRTMTPVVVDSNGPYPYVVVGAFDGVGGHLGGERAAEIAKYEAHEAAESYAHNDQTFHDAMTTFVSESQRKMQFYKDETPDMGTTFAIAALDPREKKIHTAHGGDSKVMVVKEDGSVTFLTRDHNLAYADYLNDVITEQEYRRITHLLDNAVSESEIPEKFRKYWFNIANSNGKDEKQKPTGRHVILSSHRLGIRTQNSVDVHMEDEVIQSFDISDDWSAVVCLTDGITDNLTQAEIAQAMRTSELVSGKISLNDSLRLLSLTAREKSLRDEFRSKPDSGISATGFLL